LATSRSRSSKRQQSSAPEALRRRITLVRREGAFLGWMLVASYVLLAMASHDPADPGWSSTGSGDGYRNLAGPFGAWLADLGYSLLGWLALLGPILVAIRAWQVFRARQREAWVFDRLTFVLRLVGLVLLMAAGSALIDLQYGSAGGQLPFGGGGIIGAAIAEAATNSFGHAGSTLLLLGAFLFGVTVFTDLSWLALADYLGNLCLVGWARGTEMLRTRRQLAAQQEQTRSVVERRRKSLQREREVRAQRKEPVITLSAEKIEPSARVERERQQPLFRDTPAEGLPPIDLLDAPPPANRGGFSPAALEAMSRKLELKLQDFGIAAEVVEVLPGPVITRFELQPAPGVKASRISNLARDLARSLAVISVRVVEVIPGKSVVGIEIPNETRAVVYLRKVLSSEVYDSARSPLTLALGEDISGEPVIADLSRMPHLLVAGTTGSGKSVGVNAMLLSLLFKATPEEVRLILVDPKMLELSVYDGIPHLLTPVITDMKDAATGLRWCVGEMERRYRLMAQLGVRNLAGYNRKIEEARAAGTPLRDPSWNPSEAFATEHNPEEAPELSGLPHIVVVIDEFADMMMIVGKKVEQLIARIAQKARAAGIHLILATQRPSVDVITGLIKANVPTRIAFQVSSKIDSRTILDQGGAEQLLGHGDMLYLPTGTSLPIRVHGAFVDDHEVHKVVAEWKRRGSPDYLSEITDEGATGAIPVPGYADAETEGEGNSESDALYDEAVEFVINSGRASISSVQRKLRIGYNRAARLVEAMEAAGVVTEMNSNGSREVLVPNRERDG
jgi:S-DNA-T family DNA segregation ATPase FtsK/SpoIIIE